MCSSRRMSSSIFHLTVRAGNEWCGGEREKRRSGMGRTDVVVENLLVLGVVVDV